MYSQIPKALYIIRLLDDENGAVRKALYLRVSREIYRVSVVRVRWTVPNFHSFTAVMANYLN